MTIDPLVDWKAAIGDLADRLERDYLDRVLRFARGFGIWGSSTLVGYENPLGGRIGKMVVGHRRYAKRTGFLGLVGQRVVVKQLSDVEHELRDEIEAWLADQEHR